MMHIDRQDIEIMVQTMINERLADIAESLKSAAYCERDHGGAMENAIAQAYTTLAETIESNIAEMGS